MDLKKDYKGRSFLSLDDYTKEDTLYMLDVADFLKKEHKDGKKTDYLKDQTLGMVFQKNSTRTRVSFETGIYYLGGVGLFLSANDLQMGRGEPIKDTARTLGRYLSGVMIRTFNHDDVEELAHYAGIPVINGLTDLLHPCQALADFQTMRESKGRLQGLKLAFVGDGNNVAHSLMLGGAKLGMHVAIASPKGYEPKADITAKAKTSAQDNNGELEIVNDPIAAVKDADVVYTDVWASMGQEKEAEVRRKELSSFQLNSELLAKAKPDAIVMHCLPAKRGQEITEEVIESKQSVVFDEAENRLYAQMAVMALLMGK